MKKLLAFTMIAFAVAGCSNDDELDCLLAKEEIRTRFEVLIQRANGNHKQQMSLINQRDAQLRNACK